MANILDQKKDIVRTIKALVHQRGSIEIEVTAASLAVQTGWRSVTIKKYFDELAAAQQITIKDGIAMPFKEDG